MESLKYLKKRKEKFSIPFEIQKYDVCDAVKQVYGDLEEKRCFFSNPEMFARIQGAAKQKEQIACHELFQFNNLLYNTSFKENLDTDNIEGIVENLKKAQYLGSYPGYGDDEEPTPEPRDAVAGLVAAIVAGLVAAIEAGLGYGIAVGTRSVLWTEVKVFSSASSNLFEKLYIELGSVKIYKKLFEVFDYIECIKGYDYCLKLDRALTEYIWNRWKEQKKVGKEPAYSF